MNKKSPNPQAPAALSLGRSSPDPTRPTSGRPETDPQDAILESAPESKRWDMVPGSTGQQAPEIPAEDDDAEGRSETEQLVDDGVERAAREQADQAAAKKRP